MYRVAMSILFCLGVLTMGAALQGQDLDQKSSHVQDKRGWNLYTKVNSEVNINKISDALRRSYSLSSESLVRVQLKNRKESKFKNAKIISSGPVYVRSIDEDQAHKVEADDGLNISMDAYQNISVGPISSSSAIIIDPQEGGHWSFGGHDYTGVLYIVPTENAFMLVEHTDLESYLLGVVGNEMNYTWPLEALKAQAVVARTYARSKMKKKEPNFDLFSDTKDQVYKGSGGEIKKSIRDAVELTKGEVLTYKGKVFCTFYHANCGGHTEDAAFLTNRCSIEPLTGVVCDACSGTNNSCWTYVLSKDMVNHFVWRESHLKGEVTAIQIKDTAGYEEMHPNQVKKTVLLKFITSDGSIERSCEKLQHVVGSMKVKSCKIDTITLQENGFKFTGCGFGHGVGLCQDGAKREADLHHRNYKQILQQYFPGSELKVFTE